MDSAIRFCMKKSQSVAPCSAYWKSDSGAVGNTIRTGDWAQRIGVERDGIAAWWKIPRPWPKILRFSRGNARVEAETRTGLGETGRGFGKTKPLVVKKIRDILEKKSRMVPKSHVSRLRSCCLGDGRCQNILRFSGPLLSGRHSPFAFSAFPKAFGTGVSNCSGSPLMGWKKLSR